VTNTYIYHKIAIFTDQNFNTDHEKPQMVKVECQNANWKFHLTMRQFCTDLD